jgi:beta-galactosidase
MYSGVSKKKIIFFVLIILNCSCRKDPLIDISNNVQSRERISLNSNWRFFKYPSAADADSLIYDIRPEITDAEDGRPADARPTEAVAVRSTMEVLKPWILPTGNNFIKDSTKHFIRPDGNPGSTFPFVQSGFDDSSWGIVDIPHDWAIEGPFYEGSDVPVGGGMGRLPSPGVAWYRKKISIPTSDKDKLIFLDIDGAMSYAMVWLNGHLVGGWPYGYASWRLDLTPYIVPGGENQLAIRLDNPPNSSRWYTGGGIYRNVWLTKTNPVHIGHWGTIVNSRNVSKMSAIIALEVTVVNESKKDLNLKLTTGIYEITEVGNKKESPAAIIDPIRLTVQANNNTIVKGSVTLENPKLWGPPPTQLPNRYVAVTTLWNEDEALDQYETTFGIRSLKFDPDSGIFVNNEKFIIKGANQHHDLGSLGAAFNFRAAERQLEILREMGCNSIRTAHNPPAPEFLDLTDRMGFLVIDEIFDSWERKKTPLDFHLIFQDWHEQDVRSFIRRDRNHPSVIMWSLGNEVGEQYTEEDGAAIARVLHDIAKEEDPGRLTTTAMNYAKPGMPLPGIMDVISLNYQGEGIRDAPAYAGLQGIQTSPIYPVFHETFPDKIIISSENAAALSSRGEYTFPVTSEISAPVMDGFGGDPNRQQVSGFELYTAPFGSSADKVFTSLDKHPFVAGGFVWSGWDYLGEPTPYYSARSSYYGVIDLAGFKKNRFYLYQSHWRPDLKMAHILPHWTWMERTGELTPVHVFSSADEAELFLNGASLGRKIKQQYEYRFRWDSVIYEPGTIKVVTFKNGEIWAIDSAMTAGEASKLKLIADRDIINADGADLSFVTVEVLDNNNILVPEADILITFEISGSGEIVSTDNGDPSDFTPFPSHQRKTFNGLALVIIRSLKDKSGQIKITAKSPGLRETHVVINSQR